MPPWLLLLALAAERPIWIGAPPHVNVAARTFVGTGSIQGIKNDALAGATAANRARQAAAERCGDLNDRILWLYMAGLTEHQSMGAVVKGYSRLCSVEREPVTWRAPDGTMHARAEIALADMLAAASQDEYIPAEAAQFWLQHAETELPKLARGEPPERPAYALASEAYDYGHALLKRYPQERDNALLAQAANFFVQAAKHRDDWAPPYAGLATIYWLLQEDLLFEKYLAIAEGLDPELPMVVKLRAQLSAK